MDKQIVKIDREVSEDMKMDREVTVIDEKVLKILEEEGRKIYHSNPHYKTIANLMEHPLFREFFDKYATFDLHNLKAMFMLMFIYNSTETLNPLNQFQKIAITKGLYDNSKSRENILKVLFKDEMESIKSIGSCQPHLE